MDELQAYFDGLLDLASRTAFDQRTSTDIVCGSPELIRLRSALIDAEDAIRVAAFINTGVCSDRELDERIAIFNVALELEHEHFKINLHRSCESYDKTQPLFSARPDMWDRVRRPEKDCDLIDVTDLKWDKSSQLLEISAEQSVRISQHLRPDCVRFLRTEVISPLFVRLDPYRVGVEVPLLVEAAIRPAAPDWWRELKVFPGNKEAAQYELMGTDPLNQRDYWEYHSRKHRRLEVAFRRDANSYLHGSIEELSEPASEICTGLILHFDSKDPVGTEWETATLCHLDGAINVYLDADANQRWQHDHAHGKVQNATIRTHLFRIENVPLKLLVPVAWTFLRSEQLLSEWEGDMFR